MAFWSWSRTAASNATADSTIGWAEGQAPSTVNDSARAMMARTAEYRDDIAGAISTGGTSTAYTVSSFQVFDTLAHLSGQMIAFVPHTTSTNAAGVDVTLNVDGLGAKVIRMTTAETLPSGTLVAGTPYTVTYNNAANSFFLHNMTSPYVVPLGAGIDFWGTTAPNSSFAFPFGQAISRTTYATLFTLFGTTYGIGDGSSTFNLPDKTGRVSAMKEGVGSRLTAALGGVDGGTLGSAGATQGISLTQANMAPHTHGGTTSTVSNDHTHTQQGTFTTGNESADHTHSVTGVATQNGITYAPNAGSGQGASAPTSITSGGRSPVHTHNVTISGQTGGISANHTHTITTDVGSGSASPIPTVQPTIICNYILRII